MIIDETDRVTKWDLETHHRAILRSISKNIIKTFRFTKAGFQHEDLFFTDGSTPSDSILQQFLEICEKAPGNVLSHNNFSSIVE